MQTFPPGPWDDRAALILDAKNEMLDGSSGT